MSKKDLMNAIEVKSPCNESWDEMQGNDQVRFCSHCAKNVNNLSEMNRKEALRLVRRSKGQLCVRYIQHPVTHKPLFAENLYKITRRATGLAAGVMTAAISLSTATYAQGDSMMLRRPALSEQTQPANADRRTDTKYTRTLFITGTVTDAVNAVIPNAQVRLIDDISNEKRNAVTNGEGVYRFDDIPTGTYRLEAFATGFATKKIPAFDIDPDKNDDGRITIDASLEVGTVGGISFVTVPNYSPLATAVEDDDIETTRRLIARHANVNAKEKSEGITPLFLAVENGNVEIAETLLLYGAKVNTRDKKRQTPLMRLDSDSGADLVKLLIRHGARLDLVDNEGNTALILATEMEPDVSVIKALIDAGADVNLHNNEGETALLRAANNNDLEAVRALLLAGADFNHKNNEGETAWDVATDPEVGELIERFGGVPGDSEEGREGSDSEPVTQYLTISDKNY